MKIKRNIFFLFFLLAGILTGALIGSVCEGVSFLRWLSYGANFGVGANTPVIIDLIIFKLTLGFSFAINIAQIFTIGFAMFIYSKIRIN